MSFVPALKNEVISSLLPFALQTRLSDEFKKSVVTDIAQTPLVSNLAYKFAETLKTIALEEVTRAIGYRINPITIDAPCDEPLEALIRGSLPQEMRNALSENAFEDVITRVSRYSEIIEAAKNLNDAVKFKAEEAIKSRILEPAL